MKDKIINTALYLFLVNGVLQTSLNDVAKEIGITKGGIYHYFKNKDELLNDSFDLIIQGFDDVLIQISSNDVSLKETFSILKNVMIEQSNQEEIAQYEFILYCSRKYPELKAKTLLMYEKFKTIIRDKINLDIENGIISKQIDIEFLVLKISLYFEGTMFLNQVYSDVNLDRYVPMLFDEIIDCLYN